MPLLLARAAPWRPLLGLSAAGAVLGAAGVAVGGASGLRVLQLALVLVGGAAACALEEPAAAVVSSCPVPRRVQVLARAVAAVPVLVVGSALVLAWWAAQGIDRLLLLEVAGCWALGLALALLARRRLDEPAEVVAPALVLGLVAVMLVEPLGRRLVLFPLGEQGERAARTWVAVVALCAVAVVLAVRERRWRVR